MVEFESEEERRSEALQLVREEGSSVTAAASAVGRLRQWLSKWATRFDAAEGLTGLAASKTEYHHCPTRLADRLTRTQPYSGIDRHPYHPLLPATPPQHLSPYVNDAVAVIDALHRVNDAVAVGH